MQLAEQMIQELITERQSKAEQLSSELLVLNKNSDDFKLELENNTLKNEQSKNHLAELAKLNQELKLLQELRARRQHPTPTLHSRVQYVVPLCARSTCLERRVDKGPYKERTDDLRRLTWGIQGVAEATKRSLNKAEITTEEMRKHGPLLLYPGTPLHNHDLIWFFLTKPSILKKQSLTRTLTENEKLIVNFPIENLRVLPLPRDERHTLGQLHCIRKHVPSNATTLVITELYHALRVDRYPWSDNFILHTVDNDFTNPDSRMNIAGELTRVIVYGEKGDISKTPLTFGRELKSAAEKAVAKDEALSAKLGRRVPSTISFKRFLETQKTFDNMLCGFDDTLKDKAKPSHAKRVIASMF